MSHIKKHSSPKLDGNPKKRGNNKTSTRDYVLPPYVLNKQ